MTKDEDKNNKGNKTNETYMKPEVKDQIVSMNLSSKLFKEKKIVFITYDSQREISGGIDVDCLKLYNLKVTVSQVF